MFEGADVDSFFQTLEWERIMYGLLANDWRNTLVGKLEQSVVEPP